MTAELSAPTDPKRSSSQAADSAGEGASPSTSPGNASKSIREDLPPASEEAISTLLSSRRRKSHVPGLLHHDSSHSVVRGGIEPHEGDEQDMAAHGEEEEEEEEDDELLRSATLELEAYQRSIPDAVKVFRGKEEVGTFDGEDGDRRQEYVWDVLFENQRGIYILGKAYFSSRTLLPSDPTPFTVPSRSIPSASSITVSQSLTPSFSGFKTSKSKFKSKSQSQSIGSSSRQKHQAPASIGDTTPNRIARPINTLYTPGTFQLPSPAWEWVTPWMINMRMGTDEGGWKYNAWFRKEGWRSHSGALGWWGWVRRREWVRLRCIRGKEAVREVHLEGREESDGATELKAVMREEGVAARVAGLVRVMGKVPLDRRKLKLWENWVEHADEKARVRLQEVLQDPGAVRGLRRGFTYHSTYAKLVDVLQSNGMSIASTSILPPASADIGQRPPESPQPDKDGYTIP